MCGSSSDSRSIARWSVESGPVGDVADRTVHVVVHSYAISLLGPPTSGGSTGQDHFLWATHDHMWRVAPAITSIPSNGSVLVRHDTPSALQATSPTGRGTLYS